MKQFAKQMLRNPAGLIGLVILTIAILLTPSVFSAPSSSTSTGTGCNKLPRANPKDCSKLFAKYKGDETLYSCGDSRRVTLTLGDCSLVYKCGDGVKEVTGDRMSYGAGILAYGCRESHSPDHLVSAASAEKYWGRLCYMKVGK